MSHELKLVVVPMRYVKKPGTPEHEVRCEGGEDADQEIAKLKAEVKALTRERDHLRNVANNFEQRLSNVRRVVDGRPAEGVQPF